MPGDIDETRAADGTLSGGWKEVQASKKGYVSLDRAVGRVEYAVAYAYAEVDSIHQRETVIKCGSDDGIKVWVNGQVVHANDVQRGYAEKSDEAPVFLKEGTNRILVKITNQVGGWGYGVAIPKANF